MPRLLTMPNVRLLNQRLRHPSPVYPPPVSSSGKQTAAHSTPMVSQLMFLLPTFPLRFTVRFCCSGVTSRVRFIVVYGRTIHHLQTSAAACYRVLALRTGASSLAPVEYTCTTNVPLVQSTAHFRQTLLAPRETYLAMASRKRLLYSFGLVTVGRFLPPPANPRSLIQLSSFLSQV